MRLGFAALALAAIALAQPAAAAQKQPAGDGASKTAVGSTKQRQPTDCHRDVREHRVNGVRIRHRHVGDGCAIRVVNQVN